MDELVGDFLIYDLSDREVLVYPIIPMDFADDCVRAFGVKSFLHCLGIQAYIDILSPERFSQSQVSAVWGPADKSLLDEIQARKESPFKAKMLA
jgi:hypothetical protein